jgi:hypothetical protein
MGAFSAKFLQVAQLAADLLEGTMYECYYGIDYPERFVEWTREQVRAQPEHVVERSTR